MAKGATYTERVIVLRKRDLGESDLIVSCMAQSGRKVEAVAKGARKPSSTLSSRLELFSCAEVLFAEGKTLDIVKESRLINAHEELRSDVEKSACASTCAELLDKVCMPEIELPRVFDMTQAAFARLCAVPLNQALSIACAHLIKTLAFIGLKPELTRCVRCGDEVLPARASHDGLINTSFSEGGLVCEACASVSDIVRVNAADVAWARAYLQLPFDEIEKADAPTKASLSALQFTHQLIKTHVGASLKALNFLLAFCDFDAQS